MSKKNAFYAQSGGVTAVINASACGVIETARKHRDRIGKVYAGRNGIIGALREDLIDTSKESKAAIHGLLTTPSGAFGSCRHKLKSLEENRAEYERLIEVFRAHNIGYFFYNGGGDSADTCLKVSQLSAAMGYPLQAIHVPKTIDNDLPLTDNCPGFGSVAKYVAISTREAALDVASMCETSTKVFILEVMGRHAGWIAAAAALAADTGGRCTAHYPVPGNRLRPGEIPGAGAAHGEAARLLRNRGLRGHPIRRRPLSGRVRAQGRFRPQPTGWPRPAPGADGQGRVGYKYHWAVADYLQRSARHIASQTDVDQAYALGEAAVKFALRGDNAVMPCIVRGKGKRYSWSIGEAALEDVANREKKMPRNFISRATALASPTQRGPIWRHS